MKLLFSRAFLALLLTPFAPAQSIGINFGSGRANAALLTVDEAGVIPQSNWNNAAGPSGGPLTLTNADGESTETTVSWSTDEEWSAPGPAPDSNGILLTGWISANDNLDPPATITLTGIPFETYNLIVYLNHDRASEDVLVREANAAFPPFLAHENDTDVAAPVTLVPQRMSAEGDPSQVGNYVRFSGLTQANLDLILEPGGAAGTADRGAITGIQVVEVMTGDSDGDGLEDEWEVSFGLDPNDNGLDPNNNGVPGDPDNGAEGDPDEDGLTNLEEQDLGTFPNVADTDGDGLSDSEEVDSGTDPLLVDSDGDALSDGWELANGLNPLDASDFSVTAGAIALNLGAGRADAALLETDVAGVAAQSNWNNLASPAGTALPLNDNEGADSGAIVSWAMDEEWSIGGPAVEPNGTLLNGWFSANTPGVSNTIDLENIPYETYDLVIYLNHDRGTEDVLISESNDAFEPFLGHESDTNILSEVTFRHQLASASVEDDQAGNFLIIPGLDQPTLNLVFDPAGDLGTVDRGAIAGMQVINRGGAAGGLRITAIQPDPAAGTVRLTWNAVEGRTYAIDAGPSPALSGADEIGDLRASGEVATYTESGLNFETTPKRFYRIREISNN